LLTTALRGAQAGKRPDVPGSGANVMAATADASHLTELAAVPNLRLKAKAMINKFHVIRGVSSPVAYHYPSSTIIEINDYVADIILRMQAGETRESIADALNLEKAKLSAFIDRLCAAVPKEKIFEDTEDSKKRLNRITIHVSNDCNLRCIYCYADGGKYAQERQLMSEKTAIDAVHFFAERFDVIEHIVFFGGEPLMNIPVIEKICAEFRLMAERGKIEKSPTFGMITNGTLLNPKALDLINKYIGFITVSIDGKKEITDLTRVYPNGYGSYDKIANFIRTVKAETKASLRFEATLSEKHVELGMEEKDVTGFLEKEFAIEGTIAPDIFSDKLNSDTDSQDKTDFIDSKEFYLSETFMNFLDGIVHNNYRTMCMVGSEIIAVSVDGKLYPCHINAGKKHLSFGSIYDENIFDSYETYVERFPFLNRIAKQNGECTGCWAQKLCGGCAIRWFFDTKKDKFDNVPNPALCLRTKQYIENVIIQISTVKKNPERWKELVDYINKKRCETNDEC
jgi:uncharacterized protein